MFKRLRRIVIDDSSDEEDVSVVSLHGPDDSLLTSGFSELSKKTPSKPYRKPDEETRNLSDHSGDSSARSKKIQLTSTPALSDKDYEYYTSDDSYEEDSFVVKNSEDEHDSDDVASESSDSISTRDAEALFPFSMQLRSRSRQSGEALSSHRRSLEESSYLEFQELQASTSFQSSIESNRISSPNVSSVSLTRGSFRDEKDAAEESFEIYIRDLKTKKHEKDDLSLNLVNLKNFVVEDDESIEIVSSSEEDASDDVKEAELEDDEKRGLFKENNISLTEKPSRLKPSDVRKHADVSTSASEVEAQKRLFALFSENAREKLDEIVLLRKDVKFVEAFLLALSPDGRKNPYAEFYVEEKFTKIRDELTQKLYRIFRKICFDNQLDQNMKIEWNTRLLKTAGRCQCMKNFTAKIQLSVKVCNRPDRIRDTLLHELCHAAVFVIDKNSHGRHGPAWQKWVRRCMSVFPSLPVIERCHNYSIDTKFHYICNGCGQVVKRHTKSFNVQKYRCAVCKGAFVLHRANGQKVPEGEKKSNAFAKFVQDNYKKTRSSSSSHADVMKTLAQQFKQLNCGSSSETHADSGIKLSPEKKSEMGPRLTEENKENVLL